MGPEFTRSIVSYSKSIVSIVSYDIYSTFYSIYSISMLYMLLYSTCMISILYMVLGRVPILYLGCYIYGFDNVLCLFFTYMYTY